MEKWDNQKEFPLFNTLRNTILVEKMISQERAGSRPSESQMQLMFCLQRSAIQTASNHQRIQFHHTIIIQFKQIYFSLIGKYQIIQNLKMFASCFKLPLVSKREAIAKKSFINQIQ